MIALIPRERIEDKYTAWYRIDENFRQFLLQCDQKYDVVGFNYDFDEGDLTMGVILKEREEQV